MSGFAERRRQVLQAMDGVAIIPSATTHIRNNDVEHAYRQHSDLYYLTGFDEPGACLLLTTVHDEHKAVLFVRPKDAKRERWDGDRLGVEQACEALGVDASFPIAELGKRLKDYCAGASQLYYDIGNQPRLDALVLAAIAKARNRGRTEKPWPKTILHPELLLHEQRLIKTEAELTLMRKAADITTQAHLAAMQQTEPGKYEYELEALFLAMFRRGGCERAAYHPIVGSGPNASVLHYRTNSRQMQDGELLLIDAGCEYQYYACDVTRTFPVNGRFSEPQRRVYEVVLAAQLAGIEHARPDATIESIHQLVVKTLVAGMLDIGLLSGDVEEAIKEKTFERFYMHRTSHWLGMDVHDVGAYFLAGEARPLVENMVLTVEPGIYVSADDEEAPEEYRGIGIRIEDDILITAAGHENLTAAIPKSVEAIEQACNR